MKISDFNVDITIEEEKHTKDNIGNFISTYEPYLKTKAYPSYEGASEIQFVGMEIDKNLISFTVRFQEKLKEVTSEKHKIKFNENIYNILGIDRMNYKNRYVKFRCKKVKEWDKDRRFRKRDNERLGRI